MGMPVEHVRAPAPQTPLCSTPETRMAAPLCEFVSDPRGFRLVRIVTLGAFICNFARVDQSSNGEALSKRARLIDLFRDFLPNGASSVYVGLYLSEPRVYLIAVPIST